MRDLGARALAVGLLLLPCGCRQTVSGTYLASDSKSVCWVELVKTPDGHIEGQIADWSIGPEGKVQQNTLPITGAVDADSVTISVSNFLGLPAATLGGTLHGDTLTLSGAQAAPIAFKRAEISEYQSRLAQLELVSDQLMAVKKASDTRVMIARNEAEIFSEMAQVMAKMARFNAEAEQFAGRLQSGEAQYRAITDTMTRNVARERDVTLDGVSRSQLAVKANQAIIMTNQLHMEIQAVSATFDNNVKPIAELATHLEESCRSDPSLSALTPAQIDSRRATCERLLQADIPFRKQYSATTAGLDHLEQVYVRESKAQRELLQTAENLQ